MDKQEENTRKVQFTIALGTVAALQQLRGKTPKDPENFVVLFKTEDNEYSVVDMKGYNTFDDITDALALAGTTIDQDAMNDE